MMLKTTRGENFINTDQMRGIGAVWDKEQHHFEVVCTFADGSVETYAVFPREWERFRAAAESDPVIKAEPDYWLLSYLAETDEVDRWPVLAWRLDLQYGYHQVVTPASSGDPNEGHDDQSAVLCPNGRLTEPGNRSWDNETEWLQDMRNQAKA